jgi:hypothetical protein
MSTSTSTVSTPRKPKTSHSKKEEIYLSALLTDKQNAVLKGPNQQILVGLTFEIVDMNEGYAVVVYHSFAPEGKVSIKFHKGSFAFEAGDDKSLTELMKLDSNVGVFMDAFKMKGYRISDHDEFIAWHLAHKARYKKDNLQPEQKSINGGVAKDMPHGSDLPMLEAGYEMDNGYIYLPGPTRMEVELGLIFIGDDKRNKTATLLTRL